MITYLGFIDADLVVRVGVELDMGLDLKEGYTDENKEEEKIFLCQ